MLLPVGWLVGWWVSERGSVVESSAASVASWTKRLLPSSPEGEKERGKNGREGGMDGAGVVVRRGGCGCEWTTQQGFGGGRRVVRVSNNEGPINAAVLDHLERVPLFPRVMLEFA